jgi:protoporphyrinogen oxidase
MADLAADVGDDIWTASDESLADLTVKAIEPTVPDIASRVIGFRVMRTPIAYPLFLNAYEPDRQRFARGTGVEGLYSIGRNGEFAHILMEDVYWRTKRRVADVTRFLGLGAGVRTR